jgi:diguanylate cyclase (GGDEF)-like protein
LTKIGNRARLQQSITIELSHARRHDQSFAVLSMDLDGFKRINAQHGHAAGDEVLCLVTERLNQLVRDGDTLVRLGGDEFAIVTRHCDKDEASALAERIAKSIHEPMALAAARSCASACRSASRSTRMRCPRSTCCSRRPSRPCIAPSSAVAARRLPPLSP